MKKSNVAVNPQFGITGGKGFGMSFTNGCTVSVQWGPGNYCSAREISFALIPENHTCPEAEVAAWDKNGNWITKDIFSTLGEELHDDVKGWVSPDEVAVFIGLVKNYNK